MTPRFSEFRNKEIQRAAQGHNEAAHFQGGRWLLLKLFTQKRIANRHKM
jgi:hypothetical protein